MIKDKEIIVEANEITVKTEDKYLLQNISFQIYKKQAWAIVGSSGSGKTILGKVIAGQMSVSSGQISFTLPSSFKCLMIHQQHDFRDLSSGRSYYQQRFDSNYGEDSLTVEEVLKRSLRLTEDQLPPADLIKLSEMLKIDHLIHNRLIELSNGEGKRVQLLRALLQKPQMIVFDNPFLGLDTHTRKILHEIVNHLIQAGIFIFIITSPSEIPEKITHVMELDKGRIHGLYLKNKYIQISLTKRQINKIPSLNSEALKYIPLPEGDNFSFAVRMKNVTVSYSEKKILDRINWQIKKGERWALLGPNGAGKSTLLSLINGDNPQAYANDIFLFDQKRGSGESIWEIKKKIGYISPELHIYFQRNTSYSESVSVSSGLHDLNGYSQPAITCFEAIASGFHDQIGSSQKINALEKQLVNHWLNFLQLSQFSNQPFYSISLGEQRFILLARALVKNPPMLILDEPFQGLDKEQTIHFLNAVDIICNEFNKTLIYVSHYKEDIPKSINKFLILEKGRVREEINN